MITISTTFLYSLYAIIVILIIPYMVLIGTILKIKKTKKAMTAAPQELDLNGNDFLQYMNQLKKYEKSNSSKEN